MVVTNISVKGNGILHIKHNLVLTFELFFSLERIKATSWLRRARSLYNSRSLYYNFADMYVQSQNLFENDVSLRIFILRFSYQIFNGHPSFLDVMLLLTRDGPLTTFNRLSVCSLKEISSSFFQPNTAVPNHSFQT